ncbi:MAG: hypothetical protein U1D35_15995, partial [Paracoccaceae bacterium]|nr:hypothetical protein [Paracoccaceae bacterium]
MKQLVLGFALMLGAPALAAGSGDPDWPCVQRKQPHLSVGQVWAGPLPDAAVEALARRPDIKALAQGLQLRRTALADAEGQIAVFAAGANAQDLTALFLATFNGIDSYRTQIIGGIARYARKQTDLGAQIGQRRAELASLLAAADPDFDKIDAAEAA